MMREQCPENGIGRRIYALRQKHGMTQTELANAMHPDTDKHFVAETISS